MKAKNLSVIMVNMNTRELSLKSLRALFEASSGLDTEVFFVDNGSTDDSIAAVQESFPQVKIVNNSNNLGFSKAVNKVLQICQGEYIFMINPDAFVLPDTLPRLVEFMDSKPDAAWVSSNIFCPDGRPQDCCSCFPTLTRQFFQLSGLKKLVPSRFIDRYSLSVGNDKEPVEVDWTIGPSVLVRRTAVSEIGLFDEDFFMYGEDMDICYRLKKAGWKVYIVPEVTTYHIGNPGDELRWGAFKEVLVQDATHLFFLKHYGLIKATILRFIQKSVSLGRFLIWVGTFIFCPAKRGKARRKIEIHKNCLRITKNGNGCKTV